MPILSNIIASSVKLSEKAGTIIRDILKKGELGIVEKVKDFVLLK